jgi:Phosphorylated CTD interacting factor 1 WW domain
MYAIQGPGFQAACPEAVFDVLQQSFLKVQHECFASPLNCYYGSYCSAFATTFDGPFGSLGSFWDLDPKLIGGGRRRQLSSQSTLCSSHYDSHGGKDYIPLLQHGDEAHKSHFPLSAGRFYDM